MIFAESVSIDGGTVALILIALAVIVAIVVAMLYFIFRWAGRSFRNRRGP